MFRVGHRLTKADDFIVESSPEIKVTTLICTVKTSEFINRIYSNLARQ